MKLYAQSATTGPSSGTIRVSDSYVAVAASLDEILSDSLQSNFVKVWLHFTVVMFPLGTLLMLYLCEPAQLLLGDNTWSALEDEQAHGTVAALIQISVLITLYIFTLDIAGLYFTITSDFISFQSNSAFYLSTVTGVVIDLVAFVWVMFVLASCILFVVKEFLRKRRMMAEPRDQAASNSIQKLMTSVMVASLLCIVNHIHFVILAFISDPFHAGSMAILFITFVFTFFFIFRQFYNHFVLYSSKHPKLVGQRKCAKCIAKLDPQHADVVRRTAEPMQEQSRRRKKKGRDECDCFISGPGCHVPFSVHTVLLSLICVSPFVIVYLGTSSLLFFSLPITKSIEDSPSRLYSIYQGTGLIIVGLLTYSIILRPSGFSITKVMERLAKRLQLPEHTNYWNKLTDEEKCAKVVSTLMEAHLKNKLYYAHELSDDDGDGDKYGGTGPKGEGVEEVSAIMKAKKVLKKRATGDCIQLLSLESKV